MGRSGGRAVKGTAAPVMGGGGLCGMLSFTGGGAGVEAGASAADLSSDEVFFLECWRNSADPSARFWASGVGDGGLGVPEGSSHEEGEADGPGSKKRVPRKHYMRSKMPFRDSKAKDALVQQHESAGLRAVLTTLARRESSFSCLSCPSAVCHLRTVQHAMYEPSLRRRTHKCASLCHLAWRAELDAGLTAKGC